MVEHEYAHILELSYYEVTNAIRYEKSASFDEKEAKAAFEKAAKFMNLFEAHNFEEIIGDAFRLALKLNIAAYDAAFIALADKLDKRLLTTDIKLAKKPENTKYRGLVEYPNKQSKNY
ncbi:MAG: type II toxin-antitoxin system VapC family toxin [Candidatus Bathyarchaeota archaeon]|nr:type II toxin-antitoxin system VapC family toxin [Candidatus Bathyarchaeota archaeon]